MLYPGQTKHYTDLLFVCRLDVGISSPPILGFAVQEFEETLISPCIVVVFDDDDDDENDDDDEQVVSGPYEPMVIIIYTYNIYVWCMYVWLVLKCVAGNLYEGLVTLGVDLSRWEFLRFWALNAAGRRLSWTPRVSTTWGFEVWWFLRFGPWKRVK